MGSSSSKFRKHLQNGDEYAAMQLFTSSSDLHKQLDPNSSYGDNYNHDTPMHYASRHAMKSLLRIFLFELGGNPNKKNCRNETVLHSVCCIPCPAPGPSMLGERTLTLIQQQRRFDCLQLILLWTGTTLTDGRVEKAVLGSKDEKENTALHYAASAGLQRCVELLVTQGAPLFVENLAKETPCDSAEKAGHNEIALYLESKMVFSHDEQNTEEDSEALLSQMDMDEGYSGLRAQDLQEAKDQLLVETSDMLHVPLFTAEALLRNHEWSREQLLEAWITDPVVCCEKCGVTPPLSIFSGPGGVTRPHSSSVRGPIAAGHDSHHELISSPTVNMSPPTPDTICDICMCPIPTSEEPVPMCCDHCFCRSCWERYLTGKIQEGETHSITCPGYQCTRLVPAEIIETLVSREMARRYLQFDIKAFVESNPHIKWCPFPGCGRAVRLPDSDNPMSPTFRLSYMAAQSPSDTSHAVDCGNGHSFCWECLGEAHEPASCENWKNWHAKISEIKPEELRGTDEETENTANCLWLVTNSKPCSNCKSPIQKNEGCNHMKCSKCKHDFCWVCLEPWKKHSTATGGYFRCNRYEVVKKVEESHDAIKSEVEAKNKKMQELNRFVHYYSRFKNHENSYKLEIPLFETAKEKMMILAKAVTDHDSALQETKFVQDAVTQLLKARHVLKCSYVYGYYLEETGYKKPIYEFMQTELEECTEALSEMVARPYLRTPRSKIVQTAHLVQRKRHEFISAISKGLIPPDTSPTAKKKRKFTVNIDACLNGCGDVPDTSNEDTRKALIASMQDDPSNPWVKDPSGKHTNVSALLDWPEESDESDSESSSPSKFSALSAAAAAAASARTESTIGEDVDQSATSSASCRREGCQHLRARNPRTGEQHEFCSMKCMRIYAMDKDTGVSSNAVNECIADYEMDMLRALEMSRLQFLHEMGSLRPGTGERSPRSGVGSPHLSPSSLSSGVDRSLSDLTRFGGQDLEFPGLILSDPPVRLREDQRHSASWSSNRASHHLPPVSSLPTTEQFSQISLQDEERDLSLAIELSMKDPSVFKTNSSETPPPTSHSSHPPMLSPDEVCVEVGGSDPVWFSAESDTKPPNRSRNNSNLSREDEKSTKYVTKIYVGNKEGRTGDKQSDVTRSSSSKPAQQNAFGVIKDISVANIVLSEHDKMEGFACKDFSRMFGKHSVGRCTDEGCQQGERSGIVSGSCTMGKRREKCAFTQNETVSMLDPWQQVGGPRGAFFRPSISQSWREGMKDFSLPPPNRTSCLPASDLPLRRRRASQPTFPAPSSLDPADIIISSRVLESLLQGAEGYGNDASQCRTSARSASSSTSMFNSASLTLPHPAGHASSMAGHASSTAGHASSTAGHASCTVPRRSSGQVSPGYPSKQSHTVKQTRAVRSSSEVKPSMDSTGSSGAVRLSSSAGSSSAMESASAMRSSSALRSSGAVELSFLPATAASEESEPTTSTQEVEQLAAVSAEELEKSEVEVTSFSESVRPDDDGALADEPDTASLHVDEGEESKCEEEENAGSTDRDAVFV